MALSSVLEIVLGLVLVYYVLSLLVSYVTTEIARLTQIRAKNVTMVLLEHLKEPAMYEALMNHPLIMNLQPMQLDLKSSKAYSTAVTDIAPETFATALLDVLGKGAYGPEKLEQIMANLEHLGDEYLKTEMLSIMGTASNDLQIARKNVENWFEQARYKVSNLYEQYARRIALVCALVVTIAIDVDSLSLADWLWNQPTVRTVAASKAADFVTQSPNADVTGYIAQLDELQAPILWRTPLPQTFGGWLARLTGWLLTWVAVARGASFWYDVLRRVQTASSPPSGGGST
jgi:hypothetical protein